jgi:hypothetical protein
VDRMLKRRLTFAIIVNIVKGIKTGVMAKSMVKKKKVVRKERSSNE